MITTTRTGATIYSILMWGGLLIATLGNWPVFLFILGVAFVFVGLNILWMGVFDGVTREVARQHDTSRESD